MLILRPSPPGPLRADAARTELLHLWEGLDREGRRLLLAHARAVADHHARRTPPPASEAQPQAPN
ncbi:hypothetical protein ACE7GA_23000 [Roseomonas sp. CCTCC AB2023176]|uniref:hypothetical protein n=1 Tax=Roseomonas sp. CCTCC AB2023176 TaxID=3342640 RepID=UPI0035D6E46F